MNQEYTCPDPLALVYGLEHMNGSVIIIPHWQQRTMADRKFFSYKDGDLNRLDVDQCIQNNPRVVLVPLARALGLIRIHTIKKPELSKRIQERIIFATE